MEHRPTGLGPPPGKKFVYIVNPNPDVSDVSSYHIVKVQHEIQKQDFANNYNALIGSSNFLRSDYVEKRRKVELPEALSNNVMVLNCESSAEGGTCDVYLVGTVHVSKESCREVEAVISYLKPQVVFLELCSDRIPLLLPQKLQVPTMGDMIYIWNGTHNIVDFSYCLLYAKIANKFEVIPGSEFRVAYEEAMKYGGKVVLGDRPIEITFQRLGGKMTPWQILKLVLYNFIHQVFFLPTAEEINKILMLRDDIEMLFEIKVSPSMIETFLHERDQYMSSALLKVARRHNTVVAVVGRDHLSGIRSHWKQPICINDLMETPTKQPTVSTGKIIASLGVAAAGLAIIYFLRKK